VQQNDASESVLLLAEIVSAKKNNLQNQQRILASLSWGRSTFCRMFWVPNV